jgi:serine/threonine protein kinase
VKVLDGAAEHQRWLQQRFQQEIEILGKISHPAVAGIRDCGELQGQPYLVMDLIAGVTLREYMQSALTPRIAAAIVAQIGSALARSGWRGRQTHWVSQRTLRDSHRSPSGRSTAALEDRPALTPGAAGA